jgi:hypothetical protein
VAASYTTSGSRQDDDKLLSVLLSRDEQRSIGLGFGDVQKLEGVCERVMDGWELELDFILDDVGARWTARARVLGESCADEIG